MAGYDDDFYRTLAGELRALAAIVADRLAAMGQWQGWPVCRARCRHRVYRTNPGGWPIAFRDAAKLTFSYKDFYRSLSETAVHIRAVWPIDSLSRQHVALRPADRKAGQP